MEITNNYMLYRFVPTFEIVDKTLNALSMIAVYLTSNNVSSQDIERHCVEEGIEFLSELKRKLLYTEGFVFYNTIFLDENSYHQIEEYSDFALRNLKEFNRI